MVNTERQENLQKLFAPRRDNGVFEVVKSLSGTSIRFKNLGDAVVEQQRLKTEEGIQANIYFLKNICSAPKWVA